MSDKSQNRDDAAALRELLRQSNPVTYYLSGLSENQGLVFHKGKPVNVVGETDSGAVVMELENGEAIALTSQPSSKPISRSKRRKRTRVKKIVIVIYPIKMSFIYTAPGESDQVVFKGADRHRADIEAVLPANALMGVPGYVVRSFRNTGNKRDNWEGVFLSPEGTITKIFIVKEAELVATYDLDDIMYSTSRRRAFMRSLGVHLS